MSRVPIAALAFFVVWLGVPSPSWAEEPSRGASSEEAERLKAEGFERFAAADYAAGIAAMEKAYALSPAPGYLLNIGIAYDLWGRRCEQTFAAFRRFFAACQKAGCAEQKMADARFEKVRAKCEVKLTVRTTPPGAAVRLDDRDLGKSPISTSVIAGAHRLVATLDGHAMHDRTIEVEEGRAQELEVTLAALRAAAPPPPVAPPPAPPEPPPAIVPQGSGADEGSSVLESPVVWAIAAAAAIGGAVALGFALSSERDPYGGTAGFVLGPDDAR